MNKKSGLIRILLEKEVVDRKAKAQFNGLRNRGRHLQMFGVS